MKLVYPLALSVLLLLTPGNEITSTNAVQLTSNISWDDEEYVNEKMIEDK
jgi:hypothetical protein